VTDEDDDRSATMGQLQQQNPPERDLAKAAQKVSDICDAILDEVNKVIVGKRHILELVLLNILAAGNILFEDYPGLAKSLMASTFSQASGADFRRIQFTPDLLPSDITGIYMFNQKTGEFEFRPGPVFTNFLLADEINRAPPKTQAALLETMQERQVSVEGQTHHLDSPYVVMATQNPTEQEGTYPLPEAQMDRFLMKMSVGYPKREDEVEILRRRQDRGSDDTEVEAVTTPEQIVKMQDVIEQIHLKDEVLEYITEIVWRTREHDQIRVGSSPRGSEALFKLSRAHAVYQGRDYVKPDDVKRVIEPALAHRLILEPEARIEGVEPDELIEEVANGVPVPKV
jgi:MoxR-like ATPase